MDRPKAKTPIRCRAGVPQPTYAFLSYMSSLTNSLQSQVSQAKHTSLANILFFCHLYHVICPAVLCPWRAWNMDYLLIMGETALLVSCRVPCSIIISIINKHHYFFKYLFILFRFLCMVDSLLGRAHLPCILKACKVLLKFSLFRLEERKNSCLLSKVLAITKNACAVFLYS